jgi:hypothetical protein
MIKLLIGKKIALALLLAAANGSAGFDAWTTQRAMRHPGVREMNPVVRPFARSSAVYGATQGDIVVPEFLMGRLPKKWKWVGYAWLAGAAGMHVGLGVQNLRSVRIANSLSSRPTAWTGQSGFVIPPPRIPLAGNCLGNQLPQICSYR